MRHAAVLVAFALGSLALAGCASKGASGYPDAYILQADELPSGLKLTAEWPEPLSSLPNPARIPDIFINQIFQNAPEYRPDEVWAEILEPAAAEQPGELGGLMVAAAFWTDQAVVDQAVEDILETTNREACNQPDQARLLRDDQVLVVLSGDERAGEPYMQALVDALMAKAGSLRDACA